MKKEILLVLVLIPLVSSLEIENKVNYSTSETLMLSIKGNFLDQIGKESISFYEGRTEISLIYDITKIDSTYYLYAQLKPTAKNYTLKIDNVHFIENGAEKFENIEINFSAKEPGADFSISPGFIITKDSFTINVNAFKTTSINALSGNQSYQYQLSPGQTKKLTFPINEFKNETLEFLSISSESTLYKIPVKIFPPQVKNQTGNITIETNKTELTNLVLNILYINKSIKTGESNMSFNIINPTNKTINNISISSTLNFVKVNPSYIDELEPSGIITTSLSITQSNPSIYNGNIIIIYNEEELSIPVSLSVVQEELPPKNDNVYQSCSLIGGAICSQNEKCSGTPLESLEGNCCIGQCIEEEKGSSSTVKTIVIVSIILILVIIGFFSYKKVRSKYSADELKKSTTKFEETFNPKLNS